MMGLVQYTEKGKKLIGHCMAHFSEDSIKSGFNLFGEIVLYIQNLSDEDFDKIVEAV